MAVVGIKIGGRDYQVACDDGQEEHLRLLADDVDDRVRSLIFQMGGNPGEAMGLLLSALMMADELIENKKENDRLAREARQSGDQGSAQRLTQMEAAMAATLTEIAHRIEKIADQVEVGA